MGGPHPGESAAAAAAPGAASQSGALPPDAEAYLASNRPPYSDIDTEAQRARAEIARLEHRADEGDVAAQRRLAEVYEACFMVHVTSAKFLPFMDDLANHAHDPASAPAIRDAGRRMHTRCGGTAEPKYTLQAMQDLRALAAAQGDIASTVWLQQHAKTPIDTAGYRALIEQVVAADDPTAMFYLGDMRYQPDQAHGADIAGGEMSSYAWQIAACRRGLDCAAGGELMDQRCMTGGCGSADLEQLIRTTMVEPADLAQLDAALSSILALFPASSRHQRP